MQKLDIDVLRETVRVWRENGENRAAAARALGVGYTTVFDRLKSAETLGLITGAPPEELEVQDVRAPEMDRLQARCRGLERALKNIEQDNLSCAEVRSKIMGLAGYTPDPPKWLIETSPSKTGVIGVPVGHWSDWHGGEVVFPSQINYINEFNMGVLKRRVKTLVTGTIDLCFNHMVDPNYPGFVLFLGGDMITGIIHDELKKTNDLTDYQAMFLVADLITWGIQSLVDAFGQVFVADVDGNHPRATRFVEHKNFRVQNLDWVTCRIVERAFQGDPRVSFFSPDSNEALMKIWDRKWMLMHGHDLGVKGGDGIIGAAGPIIRGTQKVGRKSSMIGRDFDVISIGHWHQRMIHHGLRVNNTLKGPDEFAMKQLQATPTPASQNLCIEHPTKGVTFDMEIFLDEPKTKHDQGEWVQVWGERK